MGEITRMTLHSQALKWISEKIGGRITHGTNFFDYKGKYPDIIVDEGKKLKGINEVECVSISEEKIDAYSQYDFEFKKQRVNRTLWIVLSRLDKAFHEVKVIEKRKDKGFNVISEAEIPKSYNLDRWKKEKT